MAGTTPQESYEKKAPPAWEPSPGSHPEPVPLVSESDLVNPMLKAADVMTPSPRTCSPFSTAVEAALVFRDCGCGVLPVVDAGKPLGVLTDRDLALALPDHSADLATVPVSDLMSKEIVTVPADATLQQATDALSGHGVRRVLVVGSDGALQGILSWTDLVGHVSERGLGHVVARIVENR